MFDSKTLKGSNHENPVVLFAYERGNSVRENAMFSPREKSLK